MKTVYKENDYLVREIDGEFYPIQIINSAAHGVGRDCWGGLTESGHPSNEFVIRAIAHPRRTKSAAIAVINRAISSE